MKIFNQVCPVLMVLACSLISIGGSQANDESDLLFDDFESTEYSDWEVSGTAFGVGPAKGTLEGQNQVGGFLGERLINSFVDGDASTGIMLSKMFEIKHKHICFLVGGGSGKDVGISLIVDGETKFTQAGENSEQLRARSWNVETFLGKQARLRIFDNAMGGWGHICVDNLVFSDSQDVLENLVDQKTVRLSTYRKTEQYYKEKYRPQFHFTPEINWMNDPNGLVYFDGEYHLFYQHNPHGNEWGHMSWGHAVSTDLVHWEHLPIALHEEYGVMIFSGCCVIDHNNTSGFGNGKVPPMVAIYTGHGHGLQTQDLAYSNDRGRTWTKYSGNPVIDKGLADFRDPKVFWHSQSKQWVMVVSKAIEKVLSFYGSKDLKSWHHLSDFGPAGVKDKPNWECPDLFKLNVENAQGESKWVLEVDMGDGSVSGGSGGEYFVGEFDGKKFVCDHELSKSQWVDFGRDFYAPVSWSDIPDSDGRRIWIGWMNNWETHLLPTHPWRSAMSIPRQLSLRKVDDHYKLIQRPVPELRKLRKRRIHLESLVLKDGVIHESAEIVGIRFEALLEFEPDDKTAEFGIKVRVGKDEETVIGFDAKSKKLFVDRSKSGESNFHSAFCGKHSAPITNASNKIQLHLFVDDSSVEVFAGDGQAVITGRIFPDKNSSGIQLYSVGGDTHVKKLDFWKLNSIWKD